MTTDFSDRRLEWLVKSRGTDLAAWPMAERAAAMALLRRSPEAQSAFADALASEDVHEDGEADQRAVLDRMQAALSRGLAPLSTLWRCVCAGALMACMMAGLYLAVALVDAEPVADLFSTAQTVSVAALDQ